MNKLLLLFSTILMLICECVKAQDFIIKTLDETNDVGLYTSIALDGNNNPHISYFDATNKNLKYIRLNNGIGTPEIIDDPGNIGLYTSISIDILNNPYISYYDEGNEYLKLAYKETATSPWVKKFGPSVRLANCNSTSLILHPMSYNPIIAYFDNNDRNMKLTIFKGASGYLPGGLAGEYATEIVTSSSTWMEYASLILDNGSEPHIAYIDLNGLDADLKYAQKNCIGSGCLTQVTSNQPTGEGTWTLETVDLTNSINTSVSLCIDAHNKSHISYYNYKLKYATNSSGVWTIETVDNYADVGKYCSIAVDAYNNPHISYYDVTNGSLKYATKINGSWEIQIVDAAGEVGLYTSIAVDADNKPHISYYDATNGNLKYVTVSNPIDVILVLDRSGSMTGKASESMIDTKIQKLRDAASQFIGIMKPNVGNRLGLVQFNQDVVPFPPYSGAELSELDYARVNPLQYTAVPSIVPGGTTSIGDGLNEALNQFINAPPEPEHKRSILLVTDGMENTPLYISDVQSDLISNDVTVYALGLGYGSGINESKLVNLAEATGGTYRITSDHLVFQKLFIETLAGAVDWSVINDPIGTITRSAIIKIPVVIAPDQDGVTFTVYWEGFDDAINLELITPSGNVISNTIEHNNIRYGNHSRYIFYQLDFPLIGDLANEWAGEWQMKLTGTNQIDDKVKVRYSTTAFAENGPKLEVTLNKLFNLTGDEIIIKAYLTRNGLPLSGATIDILGDVPLTGVGKVLHEGKVNWDQLQQTRVMNYDTLSMIDHKLQILSKQMGSEILLRGTTNFRLYDDGLHGDELANDGIYTNIFTNTETEGSYTFRFVASGISAGDGLQSMCEWTKSFYNEVNINPVHSEINFTQLNVTPAGIAHNLNIAPRDTFGNYMGPGHDVKANITFKGTTRDIKLTDQIDGTYSQDIILSEDEINSDVEVQIYVDGKKFTGVKHIIKQWSLSLHAGVAIPTGTFANSYDPGYNILVDADYHFTNNWSIVALIGYNNFKSKTAGIDDTYIINISANARYEQLLGGPWSIYLGAGPGLYIPKSGDTKLGANAGFGFNYDYNGTIIFELGGDYHTVFDNDTKFIHNHLGIIYRF